MTQFFKRKDIFSTPQSLLATPNFLSGGLSRFKLLTIPLGLTIGLCTGMSWYVWDSYKSFEKVQSQDLRIQKLSGEIAYFDELLTSSARLAAATGDKRWEKRYFSYVPKLDEALAEAQKLLPTILKSDAFTKTNTANEKLVALETQAFYLVNKNNKKAAAALLLSSEYEEQKEIYSQGLVVVTVTLQKYINANIKAKSQQTFTAFALLLITLVILIFAWISVLQTILRYRRLIEFSPETIAVHKAGKIKYINSAGLKLFGARRPEELIDESIFNFICPSRQETLEAQAQQGKDTGVVIPIEHKLVRFDEQVIDIEIVETSVAYRGKPAIQVLIRDITKRKQTEAALLRAKLAEAAKLDLEKELIQRKQVEASIRDALKKETELGELKSRFVAMTSHEFRTPLTTILSSSELLERYGYKWSEDKQLNHLKRIQVAVEQMTGLLNDILLLGKAEAGKLEFHPRPLDVVKFCRDLLEEMELTSIHHKIAFRTQTLCTSSECLTTTCMDEKLLRHIFSNLLSNAIKYSPEGSTIDFSFVCQQECAVFQIADRGIGIPIADQDKLFDSFHRASNVGTISGTGLGLAIVKKSVDLHGGKLEVNSEVGVGTTITVTLPLNN